MGSISSTCKRRKQGKIITIIHDQYIQTPHSWSNMRESSSCHHSSHMQRHSISPRRSILVNKSYNHRRNISSQPCTGNTFNHVSTRTTLPRVRSIPNIVCNTSKEDHHHSESYPKSIRMQSTSTINKNEQNNTINLPRVKSSASIPIDTFLIDISNKQVRIGQPVSMHIRHLLVNSPQDIPINASHSTTPYIQENVLKYIPDICENYPNLTIDSGQTTHNTLHTRLPT